MTIAPVRPKVERPVITATTVGAIAAPIAVAGRHKVSLISDKEGMLFFYEAPFYIAGILKQSVITNGNLKRIGRVSSIRSNQHFIDAANYIEDSKEALAEYLFRGTPTDGQEIVRTKLVHPGGPEPERTVFTQGTEAEFIQLVQSLMLCFGNKKVVVTAFGDQIETEISKGTSQPQGESASAVVDLKKMARIDVSGEREQGLLKSLCDVVAKEFHFQGIRWALNDEKNQHQHVLDNWKAGPPTLIFEQKDLVSTGVDRSIAEDWCLERGIHIVGEDKD